MPSYNPALKATEYVFYVSLPSISNSGKFQANPTLASGDVQVIKDGGTPANIGTLPIVINSGKVLEVTLTDTEMDADTIAVLFSDQAGNQWGDVIATIQTSSKQFDGLATSAEITAVKATTDKLDDTLEDDAGTYRFTTNALEQAPSGGGSAPTVEEIRTEMDNNSVKLNELHALQGLDPSNPMTVTPTTRITGSITQNITGDGLTTSTVTRTND
jgi:cytoskeletal protein CcmA (bactofilin family)